ncbi:MAG: histidine phosphatase family protein [Actinomycetota bacterium]|nr:histidine phosphatase family protein [Actinomycetota bacterium]
MTELVLVRHGETIWHAENRYAGRSDIALTDRGRLQADRLGAWAAGARLDRIVTSPLQRTADTAAPAETATGLTARRDPRLVEVDFGKAEGLTRAEMRDRFPDALAAFLRRPATCPLPGGECGTDAVARARPALSDCLSGDPRRVLVVGHQTLVRLLLCATLGVPLDRYRAVFPRLDSVALCRLRIARDRPPALLALNVPV